MATAIGLPAPPNRFGTPDMLRSGAPVSAGMPSTARFGSGQMGPGGPVGGGQISSGGGPVAPVAGPNPFGPNVRIGQPAYSGTVNGLIPVRNLTAILDGEKKAAADRAYAANNTTTVLSLVQLIRKHWQMAKDAKQVVERKMIDAMRAKSGEYSPGKLQQLRQQGSSEIYMMVFSTKARQAKALIGDVMLGTADDKPWTIQPTPDPEIPQDVVEVILKATTDVVAQAEMNGVPMTPDEIRLGLREVKDATKAMVLEEARQRCERAEVKIEDLLAEGGFIGALDNFIDDLTTFKTAFLKGPIVRKRGALKWEAQPDGTSIPVATFQNLPDWERADPLMMYPAPWARNVQDGFLIERHRLSPSALSDMIGVEGYNEDAIRQVLDQYAQNGLREWLQVDMDRLAAENRMYSSMQNQSDLIDALQYWGQVTGKLLREWGMTPEQVPDEAKVYDVECWLIGSWVIKAVINADPLARRPYFAQSFEPIPGAFWGNSLYDKMRDVEDMCNAAARALSNNMGIASGPQVWVNNDRLPPGEDITTLYPWKIWQTTSDPMGVAQPPVGFFQPNSNANELMAVFDKFSILADEYTGIPRYMAGVGGGAGEAGRTASGMSMMIGNANKTIKSVISNIDKTVIAPLVTNAYQYVMRYVGDKDCKGDLQVVARGALSLVTKDAAQVRRNEFLQATANPIDMQIIGLDGRASLLRESAKALDMNTDKIVPSPTTLAMKAKVQAMQAQMAQGATGPGGGMGPQAAPQGPPVAGRPAPAAPGGGRQLDHAQGPVTESFQNS
jgi:hypothetical protein